jgi:hypothetical protein
MGELGDGCGRHGGDDGGEGRGGWWVKR